MFTNKPSEPNRPNMRSLESPKSGIRTSIRTKITLWAGLCLVLVSLILIGYSVITLRQTSIDNSRKEAVAIAEAKANFVKNQLDSPQIVARTLARSFDAIKDPSIPITLSRDQVNAILRKVLIENPSFLGTYTAWEPDAFDGADTKYVGGVAHDSTGRFIPYWVRGDDGIIHTEALKQYEMPGPGNFYIIPRQSKKEATLAPLFYTIQGQQVVVASFVVPIVVKDKFYGIAGVDAPIGFVQQLVDGVDMYDASTQAALFTDTGILIAVRQKPELINQPANLIYDDFETIQPQLGNSYTRLSPDGKSLQIFSPIEVGGENSHWILGLIIPFEKITAPATTAAIRQVIIGTGLIVLALGILWFLAGQVVRPMQVLTSAASAVARGNWAMRADVHSNDEAEVLANAFNTMTSQLQTVFATLEQRVADRTKDLATVAEVGTATATILQTDRLLQEVVDLTKERFNLYHSHIYLLDETGQNLVLVSGAGEPGRKMVAEGRSIRLDQEQSLVARAARERNGVTVNDVTQALDFLPNLLLPDTRSELAVPMIVGGKVIGVFDVQSDQVGRFTDSDISIQTTLAAQIATSIQNVRSFEQSQQRAELESLVNAIGQKIQRATSIDETLKIGIREVGLALGAQEVSASLSRHEDGIDLISGN
jgi:putative methionine-R-sulfoxide reductase with GAF domain